MKTITVKESLLLFVLIVGVNTISWAQSKDYRSQVLFMYNFIKYINWPAETETFVVGVVGDSPIQEELKRLALIKKTPSGKSIVVKIINQPAEAGNCSMIYVPDKQSKEIANIVAQIKSYPALIIGERDGLVKKGAEISFFTQDDDKLGFTISRKNMDSKKLKASGELLRLAELAD